MTVEVVIRRSQTESPELPARTVSVYRVVENKFLRQTLEHGIPRRILTNSGQRPNVEIMFALVNTKHPDFDRMTSIFLLPSRPDSLYRNRTIDPREETVVEIGVDPDKALVVDGQLAAKAADFFNKGNQQEAEEYARRYWETAKTLTDYLATNSLNKGLDSPYIDVLIPFDIAPKNIKTC